MKSKALSPWAKERRKFSPVIDRWLKVRTSLDEAAGKIKKTTPGFDLDNIPLTDKKVLAFMLSGANTVAHSRPWTPFSNVQARTIFRLAKISAPRFEDFMHVRSIWTGKAYGSGLTNEYIARRSGAAGVSVYAWTKTVNGVTALNLSSKPVSVGGQKQFRPKIYPCPEDLRTTLKETCGLILFLDQLETICSRIAGFNKKQVASMLISTAMFRKNGVKFLANAKSKGYAEACAEEIHCYIGYDKYSQPMSRAESHKYVKYAYLHAYLQLYYPNA